MTVRQAISRACETVIVGPLTRQIIDVINELSPNSFADLRLPQYRGLFSFSQSAQPFLQKRAADSLAAVARRRGRPMQINSALRSLPQQLLLWNWGQMRRCGISVVAPVR